MIVKTRRELQSEALSKFERARAEAEGVFFKSVVNAEKKIRNAVKRERPRQPRRSRHYS